MVGLPWYAIAKGIGISLILTLMLELLFAVFFRIRNRKDILLVFLVNMLTNPVVVFLYYIITGITDGNSAAVFLLALEAMAITVEALYYRKYGTSILHPVWFAAGANVFSFSAGRAIQALLTILR